MTLRAALRLLLASAVSAVALPARAEPPHEAPPTSIAWGLRFGGLVGGGTAPYASNGGGVLQGEIDAEHWLSKHLAIGAQLGFRSLTIIDFGGPESGGTNRVFLGPTVALHGSDVASFPELSLALGYALGQSVDDRYCDTCDYSSSPSGASTSSHWTGTGSGPYASLTGGWLFHTEALQSGEGAFVIGPLLRLDCFAVGEGANHGEPVSYAFTFRAFSASVTIGVTMGFDVAR